MGNALSYGSLEKVGEVQTIATDLGRSPGLRELAAEAVTEMDQTGKIDGPFQRVRTAVQIEGLELTANDPEEPVGVREVAHASARALRRLREAEAPPADVDKAAREALARIQDQRRAAAKTAPRPPDHPDHAGRPVRAPRSVQAFIWTWTDMAQWHGEWDPEQIGPALSPAQWDMFTETIMAGNQFHARAMAARDTHNQTQAA